MAAMVARGSSQLSPPPSVSGQDKGSRNKRKFRADPPLVDPTKVLALPQMDCPNYEFGKFHNNQSLKQHSVCGFCSLNNDQMETFKSNLNSMGTRGLYYSGCNGSSEELEVEEYHDADWSDITETQLEELVLSNLDMIFKSAVKKIVSYGYAEEVVTKAILQSGLCYGCKDTVSNIVENTLAFLKNGQEVVSSRDHFFEDLQQLERYLLAEMVCVLREVFREVRPFFSTGDAIWCLLICDMNLSHACAMGGDPLNSFGSDENTGRSFVSTTSQPKSEDNICIPSTPELDILRPNKPNHSTGQVRESSPPLADAVEEPATVGEECVSTISRSSVSRFSALEEKSDGGRKGRTNSCRRESALRQESIHLEKMRRAYGSKGALRSAKLSGLGSFFSDKKYKSVPDSASTNLKNASMKITKSVGMDASQTDGNTNLSIEVGPTFESGADPKAGENASGLPLASTELSLSLPSETNDASKPTRYVETANCGIDGISSDKVLGQWIPNDKSDKLLKLVRVRELQIQMQEWTEWAQQKVMQAARRLSKDKAELRTLRQEKEEVARLKKEKQALEENTLKKLVEMENALCKASGQVERANAAVRRLELENCELRQEMEAAKLQAAESALSCQEVMRREKKPLKNFQSWERQKILFQEELVTERHKLPQLQQLLEQAKEFQDQLEARRRLDEKVKEEALMQAGSERTEREKIEASAKSKEDFLRQKAESDLQRYRDHIQRIEKEIAHLRLKTDSSKIAALHWDTGITYASRLTDVKSIPAIKGTSPHCIFEMIDLQGSGIGDVPRERECVMCLTDEMAVVFLPCAHRVVCVTCNELLEKHGMNDCPSCRTPIQRRICVRSADY